jgi:methylmalonyl-CoA mutase C-terminal domain/subunit
LTKDDLRKLLKTVISQVDSFEENMRPIRVLIAKPGLDGHDRGALLVARALRDAGMEVIYTGLHQTIPNIVEDAIQEDVDVIGLSILSGAHLSLIRKLMEHLHKMGVHDKIVIVGGTISPRDIQTMETMGVKGVFPVGTQLSSLAKKIRELVEQGSKIK